MKKRIIVETKNISTNPIFSPAFSESIKVSWSECLKSFPEILENLSQCVNEWRQRAALSENYKRSDDKQHY